MADFSYVITLKNDTSNGVSSAVAGQEVAQPSQNVAQNKNPNISKVAGGINTAWATVKGFANNIISHEISMVQLRTGSKEKQQQTAFTFQAINKGVNIMENVAKVGYFSGGNVGAGTAALALQMIKMFIDIKNAYDKLSTERTVEHIGLRQNLIRAGARGSRTTRE